MGEADELNLRRRLVNSGLTSIFRMPKTSPRSVGSRSGCFFFIVPWFSYEICPSCEDFLRVLDPHPTLWILIPGFQRLCDQRLDALRRNHQKYHGDMWLIWDNLFVQHELTNTNGWLVVEKTLYLWSLKTGQTGQISALHACENTISIGQYALFVCRLDHEWPGLSWLVYTIYNVLTS